MSVTQFLKQMYKTIDEMELTCEMFGHMTNLENLLPLSKGDTLRCVDEMEDFMAKLKKSFHESKSALNSEDKWELACSTGNYQVYKSEKKEISRMFPYIDYDKFEQFIVSHIQKLKLFEGSSPNAFRYMSNLKKLCEGGLVEDLLTLIPEEMIKTFGAYQLPRNFRTLDTHDSISIRSSYDMRLAIAHGMAYFIIGHLKL